MTVTPFNVKNARVRAFVLTVNNALHVDYVVRVVSASMDIISIDV